MTQENKELLLKDLCARLPYGVKIYLEDFPNATLVGVINEGIILHCDKYDYTYDTPWNIEYIKPYLFPLSSMTDEQKEELNRVTNGKFNSYSTYIDNCKPRNWSEWGTTEYNWIRHHDVDLLNTWLDKNHFDYRGLIPMGLAIDATGLNMY